MGTNQTIIIQNPYQPVHVQQVQPQKSTSAKFASGIGNVIGSAVRSSGSLVKDTKSLGKDLGKTAAQAARSGADLAGHAAKGFMDEMDRTAKSPLLDCFLTGSGVQLVSKSGGGCLRCLPDGRIDGRGSLGVDYTCHWIVDERWENKVILRNAAYQHFYLTLVNGFVVTTNAGSDKRELMFMLHETFNHYVRLEHQFTQKPVLLDAAQNPCQQPTKTDDGLFEVNLAYSPFGHVYKPVH